MSSSKITALPAHAKVAPHVPVKSPPARPRGPTFRASLRSKGGEGASVRPQLGPRAESRAVSEPPPAPPAEETRRREDDPEGGDEDESGLDEPGALVLEASPGIDPLDRALWEPLAPRALVGQPKEEATAPVPTQVTAPAVDALVDRFLKRFAMSGDRHRGTAALQIGSGELAGSSVTIHAEGNEVRIVMDAAPGSDVEGLRRRLETRLSARGMNVTFELR